MYYILHGKDGFRSHSFLSDTIEKFSQKYGGNDIETLEDPSLEEIKSKASPSMFSSSRLLIIKNFIGKASKEEAKDLISWLKTTQDAKDLLLLIWEDGEVEDSLIKSLPDDSKRKFDALEGSKLKSWFKQTFESQSLTATDEALDKLCAAVGPDLWRANSEAEKIINYVAGKKAKQITPEIVDLLVESSLSFTIFELTDALGAKKINTAWKTLEYFLANEDPFKTLGMIASQIRNLLLVYYSNKEKVSLEKLGLKIHPYVVKKTTAQLNNFNEKNLIKIHGELLSTDLAIKTGKIEPALGLKRLILKVCEK